MKTSIIIFLNLIIISLSAKTKYHKKLFEWNNDHIATDIIELDNYLVISGYIYDYPQTGFIINVEKNCDTLSYKKFNNSLNTNVRLSHLSIIDNNLFVLGSQGDLNVSKHSFIYKLNDVSSILQSYKTDTLEYKSCMYKSIYTKQGEIVLVGDIRLNESENEILPHLIKLNLNLEYLWDTIYLDALPNARIQDIIEAPDGGFYLLMNVNQKSSF